MCVSYFLFVKVECNNHNASLSFLYVEKDDQLHTDDSLVR